MPEEPKTYSVGQTLFAVSTKNPVIIPAVVVEVISRRGINGSSTTYKVVALTSSGNKTIDLARLTDNNVSELFDDINSVKNMLLERSNKYINGMIDNLTEKTQKFIEDLKNNPQADAPELEISESTINPPPENTADAPQEEYIILPDGRKAKVRIKS